MCVWAIIPVKPLGQAKSRLSQILTPEQRASFAEVMLRQVLSVVSESHTVVGTLVVSRDTHVLAIAREYGAKTVQESGTPELNAALARATSVVKSWSCTSVLILPADLPFVTVEDIENMIKLGPFAPAVVIAPDRDRDGTNGLFIRPPGLIEYAYGPGSFQRHVALAKEAGAIVREYQSEHMQFDVDLPEHLIEYNQRIKQADAEAHKLLASDTSFGD
ncbi:MAG: 2-phospho-L-lactate guanylyltransferase [Chloroflexi bacterium]|nr:MAG: 2-phospho-L-lactate guanylyltransferase [Chloroflexota bacterium]